MTFLVDNQLPGALARFLTALGVESHHVLDLGLGQASDIEIWRYASEHRMTLISKGEDFFHLAGRPAASVQLVWVRLGNCRREKLLRAIESVWPRVEACLAAGDQVVEIR